MTARTAQLTKATYLPRTIGRQQVYRAAKRALDVSVALFLLLLLAPLMALIAVAVMLDSPGPAIFRQQRVRGDQKLSDGDPASRTFTFFKFRTMYQGADQGIHRRFVQRLIQAGDSARKQDNGLYKLANDPRVTRVGRVLRAASLDELPQLINVLRGDMSLVGPRPAMPYEVSKYRSWHRRRLEAPAGITGLWQVSGRNELSFDQMVRLDNQYVQNRSLRGDLAILVKTIPVVLGHTGC